VLESFVGQWILDELDGKLDGRQYDALEGRSTTHELVDILHHWHQALENNCSARAVFNDYAKTFDHVDHFIVIQSSWTLVFPKFRFVGYVRSWLRGNSVLNSLNIFLIGLH